MECRRCRTSLSIQDIDKNIWNGEIEEFVFICPICKNEEKLISHLFEFNHITKPYLSMILIDIDSEEKQLDYMPVEQKRMLLEHLSSCDHCSDILEQMRLEKISKEIEFDRNIYEFFITQACHVSRILTNQEIKINGVGIKSFQFDNQDYAISKRNLFYETKKDNSFLLCYALERNSLNVGMVSFLKTDMNVVLDKIWIKSRERLQKEKTFLQNLKTGEMKILVELVRKVHDFL